MSIAEKLKGIARARPSNVESKPAPLDSPYLNGRLSWNERTGAQSTSRQMWQLVAMLSLLIALAAVGGVVHIGSQSKFVPYVVQVDKLGQSAAVSPASQAGPADPRVVKAYLAAFITNARLVTPDMALQRKAVYDVYAMLSPNDPATAKMNEYWNGNPDASPFKRAAKETVNAEIVSILPQTAQTWQVDWDETQRDRQGVPKGPAYRMRALVTVAIVEATPSTTEEQVRKNPLGVYVRDFTWAKQQI